MSDVTVTPTLQHFFGHLRNLDPASVLDIGCGRGDLLALCRDAGITAHGIDRGSHNVHQVQARGLQASEGFAEQLMFPDRSVDWAVLRHVLHHTPNVERTIREALRVARHGVLIAEPWADSTVASQRLARAIDQWAKSVHRELGYYHRPGLTLSEIQSTLPRCPPVQLSVDYFADLRPESPETIFGRMEKFVTQLPKEHSLKQQEQTLRWRASENEVSAMGSMIITGAICGE